MTVDDRIEPDRLPDNHVNPDREGKSEQHVPTNDEKDIELYQPDFADRMEQQSDTALTTPERRLSSVRIACLSMAIMLTYFLGVSTIPENPEYLLRPDSDGHGDSYNNHDTEYRDGSWSLRAECTMGEQDWRGSLSGNQRSIMSNFTPGCLSVYLSIWLVSGLSAPFACRCAESLYPSGLLFAGRLADMYGRKLLFLLGLAIFGLFSLASGFVRVSRELFKPQQCSYHYRVVFHSVSSERCLVWVWRSHRLLYTV